MSEHLTIDPTRLTEKPTEFTGSFTPGELERLEDVLANGEGELRYRIRGALDPQRRRRLSCIIEGFVFLTCQNSLETFRHDVAIEDKLVLVEQESQLPAIDEESDAEDYLVADEPLDIRDLVEDAVLLALPMIPRKPGLAAPGPVTGKAGTASPFAALASLKKRSE